MKRFELIISALFCITGCAADLDWFIMHMLGMSADEYAPFRPSFAADGADLKTLGEKMANIVIYNE